MLRTALLWIVGVGWMGGGALAEDVTRYTPQPIELKAIPHGPQWQAWEGIANIEGFVGGRERITALESDGEGNVWVGTRHGRLLSQAHDRWTLQADLGTVQVTGVALEGADTIWLSTSEGIRRLDREEDGWKLTVFPTYYEGPPSFVSGGYIPGEDAVRIWGYVDAISIPPKNSTYAPLAISTEHGLFCWGASHGVWHHFMPHYWGANSAWLDTRTLLPHRRPTCIAEDTDGNLWIGTQWDGIVRLNAAGRDYHRRQAEKNTPDGTEFSPLGAKEVGAEFDQVVALAAARNRGVWAVLSCKGVAKTLARFDGTAWTTMMLPENTIVGRCIVEVQPGIVLVGGEPESQAQAIAEIDWASQRVTPVSGPQDDIRKIVRTPDGRIFAAGWFGLYEKR